MQADHGPPMATFIPLQDRVFMPSALALPLGSSHQRSITSPPRPHHTLRKSRESVHSTLTLPPLTRFTTTTTLLLLQLQILMMQKPPLLLHSEAKRFLSSSWIKKKNIWISIYNNIILQDKLALLLRFLHCQQKSG
jgi:hypothetical protein